MLEGVSFHASQRRREMLQFIVDETLAGRGNRLKGVTLAIAVFGRDETFDQQSDPVVRLEARRLRSDLDSYYVDAGSQDPVRITIPKGGYLPHFAWQSREARAPTPPCEPDPPDAPSPVPDPAATPSSGAGTTVTRRRGRLMLAAALLAVGGLAAIGGAVVGLRGAGPDAPQARTPAIIVLPFEAFGDIDDIDLIASGVTEELIANLMLFQDFRVYSTTASFRHDAGADPENLGRDLGVSYVVTGVMQSQNGQLHLRARLVDTQTGEVRWSGSYDEPLDPGRSARGATRSGGGDLDRTRRALRRRERGHRAAHGPRQCAQHAELRLHPARLRLQAELQQDAFRARHGLPEAGGGARSRLC